MLIGYARVSTADQRLDLQVDALTRRLRADFLRPCQRRAR
jgi:predicted site-specific integrase-resolvase